ncbi:hypothetical protein B0A62_11370 [Flavobacterium hydatis]|uniref:Uncharacterized protein n=1 Tax=Flavobacterium hydatis TaxID=991 RepID=A0ABX4CHW5_FLAHY|nr:hypothetical protein B0A62_11370 [Flavobacterium hydatis]
MTINKTGPPIIKFTKEFFFTKILLSKTVSFFLKKLIVFIIKYLINAPTYSAIYPPLNTSRIFITIYLFIYLFFLSIW